MQAFNSSTKAVPYENSSLSLSNASHENLAAGIKHERDLGRRAFISMEKEFWESSMSGIFRRKIEDSINKLGTDA
jgi:hypothetical protein